MQAMADAPEIVGVNRSAERRAQVEGEFGIKTFATLAEAIAEARPQAAFLCTAPASHGAAVMECIAAGLHETVRGETLFAVPILAGNVVYNGRVCKRQG